MVLTVLTGKGRESANNLEISSDDGAKHSSAACGTKIQPSDDSCVNNFEQEMKIVTN